MCNGLGPRECFVVVSTRAFKAKTASGAEWAEKAGQSSALAALL